MAVGFEEPVLSFVAAEAADAEDVDRGVRGIVRQLAVGGIVRWRQGGGTPTDYGELGGVNPVIPLELGGFVMGQGDYLVNGAAEAAVEGAQPAVSWRERMVGGGKDEAGAAAHYPPRLPVAPKPAIADEVDDVGVELMDIAADLPGGEPDEGDGVEGRRALGKAGQAE